MNWEDIKNCIYENIYTPSVFETTLGFFDRKKRFINPFRESRHPDSGFFQSKLNPNIWLFHDFVTQETYDIFQCVEKLYNYNFVEVVTWFAKTYYLEDKLSELGFTINKSNSQKVKAHSGAYFNMLKSIQNEKMESSKEEKDRRKIAEELPVIINYEETAVESVYHPSIIITDKNYQISFQEPQYYHRNFLIPRGLWLPHEHILCIEKVTYLDTGKTLFIDSR